MTHYCTIHYSALRRYLPTSDYISPPALASVQRKFVQCASGRLPLHLKRRCEHRAIRERDSQRARTCSAKLSMFNLPRNCSFSSLRMINIDMLNFQIQPSHTVNYGGRGVSPGVSYSNAPHCLLLYHTSTDTVSYSTHVTTRSNTGGRMCYTCPHRNLLI